MKLAVSSLACLAALAAPSLASAHIRITSPTPRSSDDGLKRGPGCGEDGGTRGSNVIVARSGSVLRLEWDETVDHESHYRISFDRDGEDDFVDPPEMKDLYSNAAVLIDGIEDTGGHFVVDVPLPDEECDNCTLQLIQVMYDKQPYEPGGNDIYYACVDLELRRDAPCGDDGADGGTDGGSCVVPGDGDGDTAPGDGDDGPGDGDSAGDGDDSSTGDGDGDGATNPGGGYGGSEEGTPPSAADDTSGYSCAVNHGRSVAGAGWLPIAGALALGWRRRRRR